MLDSSGLDIPQTAGAALVDVAIGAGYTTIVLTAWVRGTGGFSAAFIYAGVVVLTGLVMTRRSRELRPVRMISEQ